jgi:hypothetical protein
MTTTSPVLKRHWSAVVRALNEAITAAMNEFGGRHGCRPMQWYLPEVNGFDRGDVIGFPGPVGQDPADGLLVTEQWPNLLGLVLLTDEVRGYRSWLGIAGSLRIEIWCRANITAGAS